MRNYPQRMMRSMPNAVTLSLWLNTTPRLLASVAVGAVAGRVVGKFVDHRVEQDIHDHSDS